MNCTGKQQVRDKGFQQLNAKYTDFKLNIN